MSGRIVRSKITVSQGFDFLDDNRNKLLRMLGESDSQILDESNLLKKSPEKGK